MMKRVDFERALRSRLDRKPFEPFIIELEDGSRLEVRQKQDLSFYVGDSATYLRPDGSFDFVDRDNVLRILDLSPATPS